MQKQAAVIFAITSNILAEIEEVRGFVDALAPAVISLRCDQHVSQFGRE